MNKTNIYLDIDGVLLANDANPAKYATEFIKYILTKYPDSTYWLTTHCRQKENYTVPLLSRFFSDKTLNYIKQIRPTEWDLNKTEAIDFFNPFLWFDDDLFEGEKQDLIKHGVLDNWIQVDLKKDEEHLGKILSSFPIPIQLIKK